MTKRDPPKQKGPGNKTGKGHRNLSRASKRMDIVDKMIRGGYASTTIQIVLSKEWGITRRQIRNYIKKVYEIWEWEQGKATPARRRQRRHQLEYILETAMRARPPDTKTALQTLAILCRIDGIMPTEQLQVHQVGVGIGLSALGFQSQNDVRGRIDELKARLADGGPITGYLDVSSKPVKGNGKAKGNGKGTNGIGNGHDTTTN